MAEQQDLGDDLMGVDFEELDDVTQLNRLLAELGSSDAGGAFVQVYRMNKVGRDGEFLDRYEADGFADGGLLDTVRSEWGAGKYQFSVYGAGGGFRARKVIQIAPRKNESPVMAERQQSNEMSRIVELIAAQNAQTQEMLKTLASAMMTNKSSQPTEMEMLDKMMKYKELFGGEKSDTTKALLEGIQLARELTPPGDSDASWVEKVMSRLAVPAMEMIAANNRGGASKQLVQQQAALPDVSSETTSATQQEDSSMAMFKMGVMMLLNAAKKNEDVEEVADRVMVMIPLQDADMLVNMPNWFDVLCHHEKECANHKEWFEKLHAELKKLVAIEKGDVPQ